MFDHWSLKSGLMPLRGQSDRINAEEARQGSLVENWYLTEQGTLRSVTGPAEYHPANWVENTGGSSTATPDVNYGICTGLFHCKVGARDILLYSGTIDGEYAIWEHQGWDWSTGSWTRLVHDVSGAKLVTQISDVSSNHLTQFIATPTGVIIIPQGGRPLFYDGDRIAELGYHEPPAAPIGLGPKNNIKSDSGDFSEEANTGGYYHSGRSLTMAPAMGSGRKGETEVNSADLSGAKANNLGGYLFASQYRASLQFIDYWGNLSPASGLSSPVNFSAESNFTKDRRKAHDESVDKMKMQIAWRFSVGPDKTVGRVLGCTKDLLRSGDNTVYEVPGFCGGGQTAFATVPDNISTFFPDNIPGSWLLVPMTDVAPMPAGRVGCLYAGRFWIAGDDKSPGRILGSYPGKWGQMDPLTEMWPDATGRRITAMKAVDEGMLVFTETSTFLITVSDDGQSFRARSLHSSVGCVSPDSFGVLRSGTAIWLGREGFYSYNAREGVQEGVAFDVERAVRRANQGYRQRACAAVDVDTGEYRCWLVTGSNGVPDLCLTYDGRYWKQRTDVSARAVCVTNDSRSLFLAAGAATRSTGARLGLYVLDRDDRGVNAPVETTATLESHWLRSQRSDRRASPKIVQLWLRETQASTVTVEVMRDYRAQVVQTTTASGARAPNLYPNDDTPNFYGNSALGGKRIHPTNPRGGRQPIAWADRRPYWTRVDVAVPSCEVFKIRVKVTGDAEFLAMSFNEDDRHNGGFSQPQGSR